MKRHLTMALVLITWTSAALATDDGADYEKGKVYGPIMMTGDAVKAIDGNGAIIDGGGTNRCATLGPNVTLKNFTFRNGKAAFAGGVYGGKLENCTITECVATESGAALGNCTAVGCTISGCRRSAAATGVAVHGGILFGSTLTGCTISGNRADFTGNKAPAFGGIGENVVLTECTVTNNVVVCDAWTCYGLRFASSTVEGETVEFDDGDPGPTPPDPPGPDPEAFDGSVANNYTVTLEDGSVLTVSTKKQTTKKGVVTVAFTAKLIRGGITYSYSNGKMEDGKVVQLPVPKTYGAPKFSELTLKLNSISGKIGGLQIGGNRVTAEVFDAEEWSFASPVVSRVGVAFEAQVAVGAACGPVKFSASKLPSGLKIDKATGLIFGVPTKATKAKKDYLPKITATSTLNSKLKTYIELPLAVEALDDWAIGTFNGGGTNCQVKVTVSRTGKISGQLLTGGLKWKLSAKSFSNYSNGVYSAVLDCKSGKTACSCEIWLSEDGLVGAGDVGGAFDAVRNEWKEQPWKQIAKGFSKADPLVLSPVGEGFDTNDTITLKFASSGKVTAKGKFVKSYSSKTGKPSFYSASCSTVLCPVTEPDNASDAFEGIVHIYYPPKAKTPLTKGYVECVTVYWNGSAFEVCRHDDE